LKERALGKGGQIGGKTKMKLKGIQEKEEGENLKRENKFRLMKIL